MKTRSDFINLLVQNFPEIRKDILEEDENITVQMLYFNNFTINAIISGNFDNVQRSFDFIESIIKSNDVSSEVLNSIFISYLGHLKFEEYGVNGRKAKKILSLDLLEIRNDLHNYYHNLKNDPVILKFLNDLGKEV